MHELSVAMSLLDEVGNVAQREHATSVSGVHLKIGRLSGIAHDALRFAWELARDGTVASSAELHIEAIDVVVFCQNCECERQPACGAILVCGECGKSTPKVVRGRELQLVGVELAAQNGLHGNETPLRRSPDTIIPGTIIR